MGYGAWSSTSYTVSSENYRTQTREQVFSNRQIAKEFDPRNIVMRESFDSEDSPESTAIMVGLDVTGSMGFIPEALVKNSLGTLVQGLLDTKPVPDPHIMMLGIGDINYDDAPLQASQFEADNRIVDQLVDIYLEGGGGGNAFESYDLVWAFAAQKTNIDCFNKRGKKGYLFTIGDEETPRTGSPELIKKAANLDYSQRVTEDDLLKAAQEKYEVFHIMVEEGSHMHWYGKTVISKWRKLLGKRAVLLSNHECLAEVILSVIRVNEGEDPETVINSWQDDTAKETVRHALFN